MTGNYIAWFDNSSGNYEVYVRRWNGQTWEEVGAGSATGSGISNNAGISGYLDITFWNNVPYIVWDDNTNGNQEIYVRRYPDARYYYCDDVTEIPRIECEALVALYNSTNGDGWFSNNWFYSPRPCNWDGITCEEGNIISIDLGDNQHKLEGRIPPEIGDFSELEILDLSYNQLIDNIPVEISYLSKLQVTIQV